MISTVLNQPNGSLNSLMEDIEKFQYQAAGLAITGVWQGSNRIKLYESWNNVIITFYGIIAFRKLKIHF